MDNYIREFIDIEQEESGFSRTSIPINGTCKYEIIHGKIKLKLTMKQLESRSDYKVSLVRELDDQHIGLEIGNLVADEDGRCQFNYKRSLDDSDEGHILRDFDVLLITLDTREGRDFSVIAKGCRRETFWRQNFRYLGDKVVPLKTFAVHMEESVQMTEEKETSEDVKDSTMDQPSAMPPMENEEQGTDQDPMSQEEEKEDIASDNKDGEADIFIDTEDDTITEENPPVEDTNRATGAESFREHLKQLQRDIEKDFKQMHDEMNNSDYGDVQGIDSVEEQCEDHKEEDVTITLKEYHPHASETKDRELTQEQKLANKAHLKQTQEENNRETVEASDPDENLEQEEVNEEMETVDEENKEEENNDLGDKEVEDGSIVRFSRKADYIFDTYPRLKPFEGNKANENWIRIEPRDIAIFPINTWKYMNNPFLINGYYKHQHILLGERITEENHRVYTLAVPAQYNNKQVRIAQVHGFDRFRSCRPGEAQSGEFGYWVKEIHIQP